MSRTIRLAPPPLRQSLLGGRRHGRADLALDGAEAGRQAGAEGGHGADNDDGDQAGDQAIFNSSGSVLIGAQVLKSSDIVHE